MATTEASTSPTCWWAGEDVVRISCVPRHVPIRDDGRPINKATVYLWTTRGIGGIKLRRFRIGGQWCTTKQELVRWQMRLTEEERCDESKPIG